MYVRYESLETDKLNAKRIKRERSMKIKKDNDEKFCGRHVTGGLLYAMGHLAQ